MIASALPSDRARTIDERQPPAHDMLRCSQVCGTAAENTPKWFWVVTNARPGPMLAARGKRMRSRGKAIGLALFTIMSVLLWGLIFWAVRALS